MENKTPRYTTIIHKIRLELDLTCNEYCVADIIFSLSNNPDSKIRGWCYAAKNTIGEFMGISERRIRDIIERLIVKGIVEKDRETKYLKTTSLWYQSVVLERLKMKNIRTDETSATRTERPKKADGTSDSDADGTSDNKNNTNKNIYINTNTKSETNELIDLFKDINPMWEKLFVNNTERRSIENMVEKIGSEKLISIIRILPKTNATKYAPTITTPLELERNMGKLIAYVQKEKNNINEKRIAIL